MKIKEVLDLFSTVIEKLKVDAAKKGFENKNVFEMKEFLWNLYLNTMQSIELLEEKAKEEKNIKNCALILEAHAYRALSALSSFTK
ncbi:MAG: hypothetical protein QXQ82_00020 [Candidatus Pacearchaeota archaeon]